MILKCWLCIFFPGWYLNELLSNFLIPRRCCSNGQIFPGCWSVFLSIRAISRIVSSTVSLSSSLSISSIYLFLSLCLASKYPSNRLAEEGNSIQSNQIGNRWLKLSNGRMMILRGSLWRHQLGSMGNVKFIALRHFFRVDSPLFQVGLSRKKSLNE